MSQSPRTVIAIVLLAACASCKPKPEERAPSYEALGEIAERYRAPEGQKGKAAGKESLPGWDDYDDARTAVGVGDIPRAIASLERAAAANPECAEYWYNLGAAQANRAVEVVHEDETEAVSLFTASVASKRRALELMDEGKFQFYDESQQRQVRSDAENGLVDADAVLADTESLVAALKLHAGAR